jgi:hypothetical protein
MSNNNPTPKLLLDIVSSLFFGIANSLTLPAWPLLFIYTKVTNEFTTARQKVSMGSLTWVVVYMAVLLSTKANALTLLKYGLGIFVSLTLILSLIAFNIHGTQDRPE